MSNNVNWALLKIIINVFSGVTWQPFSPKLHLLINKGKVNDSTIVLGLTFRKHKKWFLSETDTSNT